jgi:hypothetical protein
VYFLFHLPYHLIDLGGIWYWKFAYINYGCPFFIQVYIHANSPKWSTYRYHVLTAFYSSEENPHHEVLIQVLKRLQADSDRDVRYFALLFPSATDGERVCNCKILNIKVRHSMCFEHYCMQ